MARSVEKKYQENFDKLCRDWIKLQTRLSERTTTDFLTDIETVIKDLKMMKF